jgi:hypothetical protein
MFVGHEYYIKHAEEKQTNVSFENMPLEQFSSVVKSAGRSNTEKTNDAIAKADSYSFQIAHPEFLRTANNTRLIDHWLKTQGIDNPTFPDFVSAYEAFKDSGLLDIDKAELARDKKSPRTYNGVYTKQTFDSVHDLIAAERHAALTQVTSLSDEEAAFDALPPEEALALLKEGERISQQHANASEVQDEADAWLMLHAEWRDDIRNAKLMAAQLKANGATKPTIADFEKASRQLRESGLVRLNPVQVAKQHAKDLQRRANEAAASIFDPTTEDQMEHLPLDELRRRANGNFSGVGF